MPAPINIGDAAKPPNSLFSKSDGFLFEIHPPQRRFRWEKDQVKQLWDDIRNAHTKGRASYFLGTLLLARIDEESVSVIDGQQRITTLSLLLAVLRDLCNEYSSLKKRAGGIQQLIIRVDNDYEPRGPLGYGYKSLTIRPTWTW